MTQNSKKTKAQLVEELTALGVDASMSLKKDELVALLDAQSGGGSGEGSGINQSHRSQDKRIWPIAPWIGNIRHLPMTAPMPPQAPHQNSWPQIQNPRRNLHQPQHPNPHRRPLRPLPQKRRMACQEPPNC